MFSIAIATVKVEPAVTGVALDGPMVIAIWLGHESTATTHIYVEADLAMKEKVLSRIEEMPGPPLRYRADRQYPHC